MRMIQENIQRRQYPILIFYIVLRSMGYKFTKCAIESKDRKITIKCIDKDGNRKALFLNFQGVFTEESLTSLRNDHNFYSLLFEFSALQESLKALEIDPSTFLKHVKKAIDHQSDFFLLEKKFQQ